MCKQQHNICNTLNDSIPLSRTVSLPSEVILGSPFDINMTEIYGRLEEPESRSYTRGTRFNLPWISARISNCRMPLSQRQEEFSQQESSCNPMFNQMIDSNGKSLHQEDALVTSSDTVENDDSPPVPYSLDDSIMIQNFHDHDRNILFRTPASTTNVKIPFFHSIMNALFMMYHK